MTRPDVSIAGAGIIGLTLALALARRGAQVAVFTAAEPMQEASSAAAGMLAAEDPDNPAALLSLARHSRTLYPALLEELAALTGVPSLRFQTAHTLQALPPGHTAHTLSSEELHALCPTLKPHHHTFIALEEASLDPREFAAALIAAVRHSPVITLHTGEPVLSVSESATAVHLRTTKREAEAAQFVDCTGAWSLASALCSALRILPRKGQMLTVPTPPALAGGLVLRTGQFYLVPRLHGPRAGQTVVGATLEEAGFDRVVHPHDLAQLLARAAAFLPELAGARIVQSWAGLRPATPDLLPYLGPIPGTQRLFIASGHYRNGILLAPGTAEVMAQLLLGESPAVSLEAFSPARVLGST